jgi:catechol 2,3-dioxygenase-like lactoylglutathione lyase family enzyme
MSGKGSSKPGRLPKLLSWLEIRRLVARAPNHSWRALVGYAAICTACAYAGDFQFSGIAAVAVKVSDATRSDRFYRDVFGFDPLPNGVISGNACYKVNDEQFIKIVPGRSDGTDHHIAYFSLATNDIRGTRELLKRRGVEVTDISRGAGGSLQCTLADPDGNRIVMTQVVTGSQKDHAQGKMPAARSVSTHLRHVGIQVANLEVSAKFYHDNLGLATERFQRGKTRWVDMRLPGGDYIQMQIAPENVSADRRWSLEHFGLDVQDAHVAYEELMRRGVPPSPGFEPVVGYAGHLKINFLDPDNILIELMELGAAKATERREP